MAENNKRRWPSLGFCGLVVPTAPIVVLILHVRWNVQLSWELLALLAFAYSPVLLPLFATYIRKFSGVEAAEPPREAGNVAPQKEKPVMPEVEDFSAMPGSSDGPPVARPPSEPTIPRQYSIESPTLGDHADLPTFAALTPAERRIMRTFERAKSKSAVNLKTWGFKVAPPDKSYLEFIKGAEQLMQRKMVHLGANGLIGLTERGLAFFNRNLNELEQPGPAWLEFVPVTEEKN